MVPVGLTVNNEPLQIAFCSLDNIILPYISNNNVNNVLKMLAKEILITWITRNIIFSSIDNEKLEKVLIVINIIY